MNNFYKYFKMIKIIVKKFKDYNKSNKTIKINKYKSNNRTINKIYKMICKQHKIIKIYIDGQVIVKKVFNL